MGIFGKKSKITSAVYPQICAACGKVIKEDQFFCNECFAFTRTVSHPTCTSCGRSKKRCIGRCAKPNYDFICAPFYYIGAIRESLMRMKFDNRPKTSEFFAPEMVDFLKTEHPDFTPDIITYVPMTRLQLEERTYNQSRLLAKNIGEIMNVTCSDDILIKKYDIEPQHNLRSVYRAGNVLGAFDVTEKELIDGKTVLLVDDIKTTGSTLNECAKILKMYGAAQVGCICAAVVM